MSELNELMENLTSEDIIDIMGKLGADEFQKTNDAIIFPTVCHHQNAEDGSMKLYYYP